jgi:hypothetical protein
MHIKIELEPNEKLTKEKTHLLVTLGVFINESDSSWDANGEDKDAEP